ncbi:Putative Integrase [Vibrio nigripulchritudo SFn27]|uniref:Putative Integrase n=1 Tax=Vibrio nigripulchritudo TaxID=28173 RepID=U4KHE9_9VIBR|nr:site-specific integrase [Vibrio nigripulchritudo]CCN85471.1 Putative Integrase [Vibrio nigripulchritudo BLFn1]CCN89060.1 Putative Integrase [Vibrio nigripulchritudo SFn27]CCN95440.1 Putative Integrase [Vibrio nigripulchritudo ENn2]CCO43196.1 Putative Integrase [Vibrio nigripulchritudo SFn135]CCO54517.1 Putative Integrase [Vibrio nigripulchritudo Wn13]
MASFTIEKRTLKSGESRFKVTIFVKKGGRIIHRESKTFRKKEIARTHGKNRVQDIETQGVLRTKAVPLGVLLDKFMDDRDLWEQTGRTKQYTIRFLRDCDIAKVQSNELKSSDLIEHCRIRKAAGAKPVTIYHDIAYLRSVMKKAKPVFDIDANFQIFEEAVPVLIDMKLVGKSQKRTRRPTSEEIERLKEALHERQKTHASKIPFVDILEFSILTCMRIGEVCKLRWEDLNQEHKTVLVRDRKDPRKKEGNHMIVPLLGESFDIVKRQPTNNALIFPYNSRSVTAGFQRVRNSLGIEDLRYHDLRREGASRLFEKGYSIEEVAQVTGHRNLNVLWQVYTQLFPHKLHERK